MKDNFQIIFLVVFIFAAIVGILVFSGAIPLGGDEDGQGIGTVFLWGTVKSQTIIPLLEEFNATNENFVVACGGKVRKKLRAKPMNSFAVLWRLVRR